MNELLNILLKLVGFDYQNKRAKDKILLEQLLELLPTDSAAINLLKYHDIGAPIHHATFTPLDNFSDLWDAPDKIFQVKKLEKLKVIFWNSLNNFLDEYGKYSSGTGSGYLSIDVRDFEDRPHIIKIHDNLNSLARESYSKYEDLIKTARSEI